MWPGRSGVRGGACPLIRLKSEARCFNVGAGSEDGIRVSSFGRGGVEGFGDFDVECLSFRANLRNGEIDRERVLPFDLELLGGVKSFPAPFDCEVIADMLDPASLGVGSLIVNNLRTPSISRSVRAMRSWR